MAKVTPPTPKIPASKFPKKPPTGKGKTSPKSKKAQNPRVPGTFV